jgi:hypothetical protein
MCRLWGSTLADLTFSAVREHVSQQSNLMKTFSPSKISLLLFIAAIVSLIIAGPMVGVPHLTPILLLISSIALLLRGVTEWFRPLAEWPRGLIWAAGIALMYSLICPAWAHLHAHYGSRFPIFSGLTMIALLLNVVVPLVRTGLALTTKRPC